MAERKKSDGIRNTIFLLLILTIIISAISTWVILDTISAIKQQSISAPAVQQKGYVGITVLPRPGEARVTGGVTLEILPNPSQ